MRVELRVGACGMGVRLLRKVAIRMSHLTKPSANFATIYPSGFHSQGELFFTPRGSERALRTPEQYWVSYRLLVCSVPLSLASTVMIGTWPRLAGRGHNALTAMHAGCEAVATARAATCPSLPTAGVPRLPRRRRRCSGRLTNKRPRGQPRSTALGPQSPALRRWGGMCGSKVVVWRRESQRSSQPPPAQGEARVGNAVQRQL